MAPSQNTLGNPIPAFTEHAISVSLPKWVDNVGYEEGEARVVDVMQSGYPRFFIHLNIKKLSSLLEQKFGTSSERSLLFPSRKSAEACRAFLAARDVSARVVQHCISDNLCIFLVLFLEDKFSIAKQFWQHTGLGVSSRLATQCLAALTLAASPPSTPTHLKPMAHRHYASKSSRYTPNGAQPLETDQAVYLEERYGRNLDVALAKKAKGALRRRIAGVLVRDESAINGEVEVTQSVRGVAITEHDVFLFPTGMSAIWSAHQLALDVRGDKKSVCFGFPYTDTVKVLEKWGPGCYFLGHGLDSSIDELEEILEAEQAEHPDEPPILALFTEFPSNPLLRSADLPRLRALADKYDFLIVIDDSIGNFVNVETLPFADIVVTSLTKLFSGDSNVMGGSLVLNPARKQYASLRERLLIRYEDIFYDEDAIFMERNSRNFSRRAAQIDVNAERVCDFLHAASQKPSSSITDVFYPKWQTAEHYAARRLPGGGFGGLFSLSFVSQGAAEAFYDALACDKGPSLGTNFTLACPYTILAHYGELDWAAQYGVPRSLVRVSVGMEDVSWLDTVFANALRAAEEAYRAEANAGA
ncbi:pyridoxal phosphate-dependent transferase [Multifurca ochricompacta]|uniref:cystathionine gamma-synthase n=1 Tax=Multifurca ochricompacta TaxID=376703 RepID=A0AAD4M3T4_9AGAM|nr:pyridoxal phosphate-dependent transferase [Multifurca ochricompacta]